MRPTVLSIAGFDPSGGAGILADIKTFETLQVYGLGVCSAITFQNDMEFEDVKVVAVEDIIRQIKVLQKRYKIDFIKIGLIENLNVLEQIINQLSIINYQLSIIWDPILKASVGFMFHDKITKNQLFEICKKVDLITPNAEEIKMLFPELDEKEAGIQLSQYCNVLLKSWKQEDDTVCDLLFQENKIIEISGEKINQDKHGTGCVLSAAILANWAKGDTLEDACRKAKRYVEKFRLSSEMNLGYHKFL